MNEPKISIIIPVYNVEKYLAECLESCINQTMENIEIICVDDASPDNSIKILEEYQIKDSRIKVFKQKENKKQGAARNIGLENATGEYIWFVDSDDYIDTKSCQILYDAIKEFDIDLLAFSALRFSEIEGKRIFFYDKYYHQGVQINKIYHPQTNWKEVRFSNLNVVPWAYLTKKEALENFRFREGVWYEDTDFTPILLSSVNSFCYIPYSAYFQRVNPESTTRSKISLKRLEDSIESLEHINKFILCNKIKRKHFICEFLTGEICDILGLCKKNPSIKPKNFSTLMNLQKKYHYPKYSLKRFIGKVWKRFYATNV